MLQMTDELDDDLAGVDVGGGGGTDGDSGGLTFSKIAAAGGLTVVSIAAGGLTVVSIAAGGLTKMICTPKWFDTIF